MKESRSNKVERSSSRKKLAELRDCDVRLGKILGVLGERSARYNGDCPAFRKIKNKVGLSAQEAWERKAIDHVAAADVALVSAGIYEAMEFSKRPYILSNDKDIFHILQFALGNGHFSPQELQRVRDRVFTYRRVRSKD